MLGIVQAFPTSYQAACQIKNTVCGGEDTNQKRTPAERVFASTYIVRKTKMGQKSRSTQGVTATPWSTRITVEPLINNTAP